MNLIGDFGDISSIELNKLRQIKNAAIISSLTYFLIEISLKAKKPHGLSSAAF
jgi:hypothetical protein